MTFLNRESFQLQNTIFHISISIADTFLPLMNKVYDDRCLVICYNKLVPDKIKYIYVQESLLFLAYL